MPFCLIIVTLFIASAPPEAQLSMCLDSLPWYQYEEGIQSTWRLWQVRSGCINANYKVCTTRAVVHENVRTPHNWACLVSKGSSEKFDGYNFNWKHSKFCTFILYRPCIFLLPSPPPTFLSYKQHSKLNKSQKSFWTKTNTCKDGTLKNQPN